MIEIVTLTLKPGTRDEFHQLYITQISLQEKSPVGFRRIYRTTKAATFSISQRIFYNKEKDECRTEEVNGVFDYIAERAQVLQEYKSRNPKKKLDDAALVAPRALESKRALRYFEFLYQNAGKCRHFPT